MTTSHIRKRNEKLSNLSRMVKNPSQRRYQHPPLPTNSQKKSQKEADPVSVKPPNEETPTPDLPVPDQATQQISYEISSIHPSRMRNFANAELSFRPTGQDTKPTNKPSKKELVPKEKKEKNRRKKEKMGKSRSIVSKSNITARQG